MCVCIREQTLTSSSLLYRGQRSNKGESKVANSIQEAQRLGQSIWLDYIRRELITSGELKRLVEGGVSGMTSNPTIFYKAKIGVPGICHMYDYTC